MDEDLSREEIHAAVSAAFPEAPIHGRPSETSWVVDFARTVYLCVHLRPADSKDPFYVDLKLHIRSRLLDYKGPHTLHLDGPVDGETLEEALDRIKHFLGVLGAVGTKHGAVPKGPV